MGTFLFNQQAGRDTADRTSPPSPPAASLTGSSNTEVKTEEKKPELADTSISMPSMPEFTLFQVQVGSFYQQANAERLAQKFSDLGLPVEQVAAGDLTQVKVGLFLSQSRAELFRDQISLDVEQPLLVRKLVKGTVACPAADEDYCRVAAAVAGNLLEVLTAAEEGQLEVAVREASDLREAVAGMAISTIKKQTLTGMLADVGANLSAAAEGSAHQRTAAVCQSIAAFSNWQQGLCGAD